MQTNGANMEMQINAFVYSLIRLMCNEYHPAFQAYTHTHTHAHEIPQRHQTLTYHLILKHEILPKPCLIIHLCNWSCSGLCCTCRVLLIQLCWDNLSSIIWGLGLSLLNWLLTILQSVYGHFPLFIYLLTLIVAQLVHGSCFINPSLNPCT